MELLWAFLIIGGPILLALALVAGKLLNKSDRQTGKQADRREERLGEPNKRDDRL